MGRRRNAVLLEAGIFQDNKYFKYVYLRKSLGRMVCLLFGTAPNVNFLYFLESLYVLRAGCIETNEAQEVEDGSLGVVLELPNRLRGK